MEEQRKGDLRVYVVSGLFFSCIVSGGVFLGLYMILPESQSSSWYPLAGMLLVSIPWAFWFFTFAYRCFKPLPPPPPRFSNPDSPAPPTSPPGDRKVQFAPGQPRNEAEVSNCSRESEMPLRSSV